MKLGIFKPHFRVRFREPDDSFIFINPEIVNTARILARDNDVYMLSETDLTTNEGRIYPGIPRDGLDALLLCNGRLYNRGDIGDSRVAKETTEIRNIFNNSIPQYHLMTDLKICERNEEALKGINLIPLTQSRTLGVDAELEKIFMYDMMKRSNDNRAGSIVYIGNERGGARDRAVKEFLLNSGVPHSLYGNWQSIPSKGKVPYTQSQQTIAQHEYGLCLTEDLYVQHQHRTPRMWEYFMAGAIAFCSRDYPRDESVISSHDFRVVASGRELKEKIRYLNHNPKERDRIRAQQYRQANSYTDGSYMQAKLNRIIENGSR